MTLLPTWRDHVPDPHSAREAVIAAIAKARADVARLQGAPPETAAVAFGAAAAEAARLAVLIDPTKAIDVTRAYDATLHAAIPALEGFGAEALAGVLSLVNVLDTHVPVRAGEFAEASVERAGPWLEAIARGPRDPAHARSYTTLAYAALAAGRADLARALDHDPKLQALATALDTGDTTPFHDFLDAFPKAEGIGYGELVFAARAFVVFVGLQKIGSTAKWLHRAVHEGRTEKTRERQATKQIRAVPPGLTGLSPAVLARARELFEQEPEFRPSQAPALGWSNIVLHHIDGLHGGRAVTVSWRGELWTLEVAAGMHARRFHGQLSASGLAEIDSLLAAHDPRAMSTKDRNGVPGEARPSITFVVGDRATVIAKWANDVHPDFDLLLRWLHDAGSTLAAMTVPIAEGSWVGRFEPDPS